MSEWKKQVLGLWHNLGKKQRYLLVGLSVCAFILILAGSYFLAGRNEYVPLYTNLEAKDAGEVAAKLKEMKVPYKIDNSGTAILVPEPDVYRVRLDLASIGLPRGNKGFEIFEQNGFGKTEFQNKVNFLQALQGELARTIEQMAEVERARVHIVLAQDSLYKQNEKPATASIMLKLRPDAELTPAQVRGIVNLVAHSIQGLKPENITVVDNYARVLNDLLKPQQGLTEPATVTQLELTRKVQNELQGRVQSLLEQVLGPGKAAARVHVELNFDQRVVDRQIFEPVVDDQGIVRSVQEIKENYQGEVPATAEGIPGTTSNIPGYVTEDKKQATYEKKEVTRNYEINEIKEKVVVAPGTIKRMSVAVLVDESFSPAQRDSISKAVASAIGLNPARGDTISVERIAFFSERAEQPPSSQAEQLVLPDWLKYAAAGLGVLALALLVRFIIRRREQEQDLEVITMAPPVTPPEEETAEPKPASELTPEQKEQQRIREALEELAKSKPEEFAQIIKIWLADE